MNSIFNLFSESFVWALGWTIIHSVWQFALIALLLAIVMLFLNKFSSRTRYVIMLVALACCVGLPIITFSSIYQSNTNITIAENSQNSAIQGESIQLPEAVSDLSFKERLTRFKIYFSNHMPLIVTVWMLGVLLLTLRFMSNWALSLRLKNYGTKVVSEKWQNKLNEIKYKLGIRKAVKLVESTIAKVPIVIGFFKPVILLPAGLLSNMSASQVETILTHELAHIFRSDYLVNLIQSFLEIVFFYHPAVWWISSQIRTERENCCDDIVLELSLNSMDYAKALTAIQENKSNVATALAATNKKWKLLRRIQRIFRKPKTRTNYTEGFITGLVVCICLVLVTFSARASSDISPWAEMQNADSTTIVDSLIASKEILEKKYEQEKLERERAVIKAEQMEKEARKTNYNVMLFAAVSENKSMEIEALLNEGANVNTKNKKGLTPLMIASKEGNESMVKYLIRKGADVDLTDDKNRTAGKIAQNEGHSEIVKILNVFAETKVTSVNGVDIKKELPKVESTTSKINTDSRQKSSDWKLMYELKKAISDGEIDKVKTLLENGADVNMKLKEGRTVLFEAVEEDHPSITELLIEYGADVNSKTNHGWTPLMEAVEEENIYIADILIENGADVNAKKDNGWTALFEAIDEGNALMVNMLIDYKADINCKRKDGWTPLMEAVSEDQLNIVNTLINEKVDVNASNVHGWNALFEAIDEGNANIVNVLIKNKADVNSSKKDGWTPLMEAVSEDQVHIIESLIKNKADINASKNNGWNALLEAIEEGNYKIVKLLIDNGADIHAGKPDGWNAIFEAADEGEEKIAELLIKLGADVNATAVWYENKKSCNGNNSGKSYKGWSVLMEAVEEEEEGIIELLIDNGANINAGSVNNWTALHEAVTLNRNPRTIEYLISKGADVNAKLTSGESVLDVAKSHGKFEYVDLLERNGAK